MRARLYVCEPKYIHGGVTVRSGNRRRTVSETPSVSQSGKETGNNDHHDVERLRHRRIDTKHGGMHVRGTLLEPPSMLLLLAKTTQPPVATTTTTTTITTRPTATTSTTCKKQQEQQQQPQQQEQRQHRHSRSSRSSKESLATHFLVSAGCCRITNRVDVGKGAAGNEEHRHIFQKK